MAGVLNLKRVLAGGHVIEYRRAGGIGRSSRDHLRIVVWIEEADCRALNMRRSGDLERVIVIDQDGYRWATALC